QERDAALLMCGASLVLVDEPPQQGSTRWVRLADVEAAGGSPDDRPIDATTPFYVGFTSGSTGRPRALVRDHRAWVSSFFAMSTEFGIGEGDVVVVPGSLFFSFSLIAALHALFAGATVVFPRHPGALSLASALDARPGAMHILPSLLAQTLRVAEGHRQAFPLLRSIICAGERLAPEVKRAVPGVFPNARLYEYYGASEFGFATILTPGEHEARPGSVGRPFLGCDIAVVDEKGDLCPPHETGLLQVRNAYGPVAVYGEGGGALPPAGAWRTAGDLAWRDAEGYVYLAGRRDNMVVINGENIYPEEVERILSALDGMVEVAVVPWPADTPTHVIAVLEAGDGVPDAPRVLRHCKAHLSARKVPRKVVYVEALPLTATGKIDRAKVTELVLSRG
ncbi:MAG: AMP-binding protein, partial [Dehalococcoidia bacterium]